MKNILIICRQSFGSLVDILKWCEYLDEEYRVKVVTFRCDKPVVLDKNNIVNIYVSNSGPRLIRGIRFILVSLWHILKFKGIIIVEFFAGCAILKKIFKYKKMVLDIRTMSISTNSTIRFRENRILKESANLFDFTTVISQNIANCLSLQPSKTFIIPLGADVVSESNKSFDILHLLYIGTLSGRNIEITLKGLALFIKRNPNIQINYEIVGRGLGNELENLKKLSIDLGIDKFVNFHGYIPHNQLKPFLERCNIGVSFVPITDYYNLQPPTKTFEYVLSGLYTIATKTLANMELINNNNGVLINDNKVDFCEAIENIMKKKDFLDSNNIRKTLINNQWKNIIDNQLKDFLNIVS